MCNNYYNVDKTEGNNRDERMVIVLMVLTEPARRNHKTNMISFVNSVIVLSNMYIQSAETRKRKLNLHLTHIC